MRGIVLFTPQKFSDTPFKLIYSLFKHERNFTIEIIAKLQPPRVDTILRAIVLHQCFHKEIPIRFFRNAYTLIEKNHDT